MKWVKRGLVAGPEPERTWSQRYCILPTPALCADGRLRVYFASTDANDVGRIGFVDVDPEWPTRIIRRTTSPILDAGEPGAFDDCGVNPSCIIERGSERWMYYIGYQRTERTPYLLFSGIAISGDGGNTFRRMRTTPVLDRVEGELTIRSAPTVLADGSGWRMWYVSASGWRSLPGGKRIPEYGIRAATSRDGVYWEARPELALAPRAGEEVGFGRPWVLREGNGFRMWYSIRQEVGPNDLGYRRMGTAFSADGYAWTREDDRIGIARSDSGWDSEMICYAAVIRVGGRSLMFYNGNGNGKTGFGVAQIA
jgi:hypothetical protein